MIEIYGEANDRDLWRGCPYARMSEGREEHVGEQEEWGGARGGEAHVRKRRMGRGEREKCIWGRLEKSASECACARVWGRLEKCGACLFFSPFPHWVGGSAG